jgi:hypothetical protein
MHQSDSQNTDPDPAQSRSKADAEVHPTLDPRDNRDGWRPQDEGQTP